MAIIYGDANPNHLIGTAQADDLRGYEGNDILDGAGGSDQMRGGPGNDVYITDGGDMLIESANQGIDEVRSSVSITLGTTLENLVLTGSAPLNGGGNGQNNLLTGNAGNNRIDRTKTLQVYRDRRKSEALDGTTHGLNNW